MEQTPSTPQKPRILVIDDESALLRLVKLVLVRGQYDVVTSDVAPEAVKLLDGERGFDCIITDAMMPGLTGYDLIRIIRRHPRHAQTPILMLTRKRERDDVRKAVELGVTDYIVKPIDEHLLLDKVELCLSRATGKRHVYSLPLGGPETVATAELPCSVTSISETGLTLKTPVALSDETGARLEIRIFDEIGIKSPLWKILKCDPIPSGTGFEAHLAFVGVPEDDLKKIRAWIQKESIRRRK